MSIRSIWRKRCSQAEDIIQPALPPIKSKCDDAGRVLASQSAISAEVGCQRRRCQKARTCQRNPPVVSRSADKIENRLHRGVRQNLIPSGQGTHMTNLFTAQHGAGEKSHMNRTCLPGFALQLQQ